MFTVCATAAHSIIYLYTAKKGAFFIRIERKQNQKPVRYFNDFWGATKVMIDLFSLDKQPAACLLIMKACLDHRYQELQATAGAVIMNRLETQLMALL